MAGSALAQVSSQIGKVAPDVRDVKLLKNLAEALHELRQSKLILAYHDRSDGGLLATLCEMMFAAHCGLDVDISSMGGSVHMRLFTEELGVIQVRNADMITIETCLKNTICGGGHILLPSSRS